MAVFLHKLNTVCNYKHTWMGRVLGHCGALHDTLDRMMLGKMIIG